MLRFANNAERRLMLGRTVLTFASYSKWPLHPTQSGIRYKPASVGLWRAFLAAGDKTTVKGRLEFLGVPLNQPQAACEDYLAWFAGTGRRCRLGLVPRRTGRSPWRWDGSIPAQVKTVTRPIRRCWSAPWRRRRRRRRSLCRLGGGLDTPRGMHSGSGTPR